MQPVSTKLVCPESYKPFKQCPNRVCKSDHFSSKCPTSFERIKECQSESCKEEHIEKDKIRMHQNEFKQKWIPEDRSVENKKILVVHEKWKDQFYTIEGFVFSTSAWGGSWNDIEYRTSYTYKSFTFSLNEVKTTAAALANKIFAIFTQNTNEKTTPYIPKQLLEIIIGYAYPDPLDELNKAKLLEE